LTYLTCRHWTPKEAKEALGALAQSGVPLATFASDKGLDAQRLVRWRRRLGADVPETVTFEEVSARPVASAFGGGPTPPSERDRFEIVLRSGLLVRVPESFTTDALRRLLDTLGEVRSC
jgi:hypothetical protein